MFFFFFHFPVSPNIEIDTLYNHQKIPPIQPRDQFPRQN